ncbi:MAG: OsmC family protein [Rhizobiaceae bacterium]
MNSIKEAQERRINILKKRPEMARSTGQTCVELTSGTRCEVTEGDWKMVSDQPKSSGGNDEGPDPGFFGRGAVGACLVQGYALKLALFDLTFQSIRVEIESDIDGLGSTGLDDTVPPGYQALRYRVLIESDEEEAAILKAVEYADDHSPWLFNLTSAIPAEREVVVNPV